MGDTARETFPTSVCVADQGFTGNMYPVLHEIRHALGALLRDGTETAIDLRAIPMSPGEDQRMEAFLGVGEVRACIDALGPSEIRETAVPGVWLITHLNRDEEVVGKFIEITYFPSILRSQPEDMRAGLERLQQRLGELAQDV